MTHAFFKALLFLGSGSVIHAMGGEQDMRKMGGLKKHLPITYWTFLIGGAGDRRHPAARRLLQQGRDPRTPPPPTTSGCSSGRPADRRPHRLLHVPRRFLTFHGKLPRHPRAGAPPARVAAGDDGPAGRAWRCGAVGRPAGSGLPAILTGSAATSTGSDPLPGAGHAPDPAATSAASTRVARPGVGADPGRRGGRGRRHRCSPALYDRDRRPGGRRRLGRRASPPPPAAGQQVLRRRDSTTA